MMLLARDARPSQASLCVRQRTRPCFPEDMDCCHQLLSSHMGSCHLADDAFRHNALPLQAILDWPDDGRPYVVLGRLLAKQGRTGAARAVYEQGCQALGGDNAYIWQVLSGGGFLGGRVLSGAGTIRRCVFVAANDPSRGYEGQVHVAGAIRGGKRIPI